MIRGAHIEMVGYGLIRKTDYKMYENLPHSEREGAGGRREGAGGGEGGGGLPLQPSSLCLCVL